MMIYRSLALMLLTIFISISLHSCSSRRYVKEVPYRYSSSEALEGIITERKTIENQYSNVNDNAENLSDEQLRLKEKYSIIFGIMPKTIKNYDFYAYIDPWLGTPYKNQGFELGHSVDCSYFIQALYSDVFGETFEKTPDGIFRSKSLQLFTGRGFLKEGDILFFRYNKFKPISDVAVYLHNDRILACSDKELNIFNFNDEYFQKRYVAAGRIKEKVRK